MKNPTHVVLAAFGLLAAAEAASVAGRWQTDTAVQLADRGRELQAVAESAAARIDAHAHEVAAQGDEPPEIGKVRVALGEVAAQADVTVATLRLRDATAVLEDPSIPHPGAMEVVLATDAATWRVPADYLPQMRSALFKGTPGAADVAGDVLDAYAPLATPDGQSAGVVRVVGATGISHAGLIREALFALVLLAGAAGAIARAVAPLRRALDAVEATAGRVAAGDTETPVQVVAGVPAVEALEVARERVHQRLRRPAGPTLVPDAVDELADPGLSVRAAVGKAVRPVALVGIDVVEGTVRCEPAFSALITPGTVVKLQLRYGEDRCRVDGKAVEAAGDVWRLVWTSPLRLAELPAPVERALKAA